MYVEFSVAYSLSRPFLKTVTVYNSLFFSLKKNYDEEKDLV